VVAAAPRPPVGAVSLDAGQLALLRDPVEGMRFRSSGDRLDRRGGAERTRGAVSF
jgi:hypothetical protein